MPNVLETFYARQKHGGHKVTRDSATGEIIIYWPSGPVSYPKIGLALKAITGSKNPKIGFRTYFRGSISREYLNFDILTLFAKSRTKGIDLKIKSNDVKRLMFAGFGRSIQKYGLDPEEVLQEVYKGLLIRNQGKCPWDPDKSSFGHYVHMVISCILSNYQKKSCRVHQAEQLGSYSSNGDLEDVSLSHLATSEPLQEEEISKEKMFSVLYEKTLEKAKEKNIDVLLVSEVTKALSSGLKRSEILTKIGSAWNKSQISSAIVLVKSVAKDIHDAL